jgi:hypothetical protein
MAAPPFNLDGLAAGTCLDQQDAGNHHRQPQGLGPAQAFAQPEHTDQGDQDDADPLPQRIGHTDRHTLDRQGQKEIRQADHDVHHGMPSHGEMSGGEFHRRRADHLGGDGDDQVDPGTHGALPWATQQPSAQASAQDRKV